MNAPSYGRIILVYLLEKAKKAKGYRVNVLLITVTTFAIFIAKNIVDLIHRLLRRRRYIDRNDIKRIARIFVSKSTIVTFIVIVVVIITVHNNSIPKVTTSLPRCFFFSRNQVGRPRCGPRSLPHMGHSSNSNTTQHKKRRL